MIVTHYLTVNGKALGQIRCLGAAYWAVYWRPTDPSGWRAIKTPQGRLAYRRSQDAAVLLVERTLRNHFDLSDLERPE